MRRPSAWKSDKHWLSGSGNMATRLYPFIFEPIFKERVWGGRRLKELYGKDLPVDKCIGESWEISDRPRDVSRVLNGPLAGKDLHWLVQHCGGQLLGRMPTSKGRFPLLVKILDAREKLSLQVHPPEAKAGALGGEPKTELWYVAEAAPGAELYVGLKRGCRRAEFAARIGDGTVERCFHKVRVHPGDVMFLPSGRVHALGAGMVIFEIQQNSDTTYRVYDWERTGLDGKPRELHIAESLDSIQFDDFEPELVRPQPVPGAAPLMRLVEHDLFQVSLAVLHPDQSLPLPPGEMHIIGAVSGRMTMHGGMEKCELSAGSFCLVPASVRDAVLTASERSACLLVKGATQPGS